MVDRQVLGGAKAYPDGSRMTLRPEPYRHLEREAVFRGLAALAEEARSRDVEMSALAWVLHHPQMNTAIIDLRRPPQLDAGARRAGHQLVSAGGGPAGPALRHRSISRLTAGVGPDPPDSDR